MENQRSLILNHNQVTQKIRRIAYQILENNHNEKHVVLVGIWGHGYKVANLIKEEVEKIAKFSVELLKIELDKELPTQSDISLDANVETLKNKVVILVDDVLNTGRTIAYSLKPFLNVKVKKIETAFLVNRSHTNFPISCTYTGYQLSTTINDHVEVEIKGEKVAVYLQ